MTQINEAWEQAKDQLTQLRLEVQRSAQAAQVTLQSKYLAREKDKALRDFGEAVWVALKKGKLQLPPILTAAVKAMLEVEKREAAQADEINSLLQEGQEIAAKVKPPTPQSAVAAKGKKR